MLKLLAVAAAVALSSLAHAQPLSTAFTFQGQLFNAGAPVSGAYDFKFKLFDAPAGGAQQGAELCSDNLAVTGGQFTVQLDFGAQFAGSQRFVELQVRQDTGLSCANNTGFTILTPRQSLTATPNAVYSMNAGAATSATTAATATTATNATQLNGQASSFYLNAGNLSAGTLPSARLGGTYSGLLTFSNSSNSFTGSGTGLTGLNATNIASGTLDPSRLSVPVTLTGSQSANAIIRGTNTSGPGTAGYGVQGETTSDSGYGVYGWTTSPTGDTIGVLGRSASTGGYGVFGWSTAATGTTFGVRGDSQSPDGTGVIGFANAPSGNTTGLWGEVNSAAGRGVYGAATASSGTAYGVFGLSNSTTGTGVYGHTPAGSGPTRAGSFRSDSTDGTGVYAVATAPSGNAYGLWGESASPNGRGVFGLASATSGTAMGGYFQSNSTQGTGAYGYATASTGNTTGVLGRNDSATGTGVFGWASASSTSATYGVVGQSDSVNAAAAAVFAFGRFAASGTKSFRIDHPADPQNKYLLHYCAEGPQPQNIYNGIATLNQQGEAEVTLPSYFAAINKEPRYTLTALDAPMPMLHIGRRVSTADLETGAAAAPGQPIPTCSFRIAGGAPGGEVSWEVKATRNDRWVQQHGAPVEIDKQDHEKGAYQHPDLYNQPPEKGMSSRAREHPSS